MAVWYKGTFTVNDIDEMKYINLDMVQSIQLEIAYTYAIIYFYCGDSNYRIGYSYNSPHMVTDRQKEEVIKKFKDLEDFGYIKCINCF